MNKKELGKLGEQYAENYLIAKNYQIIKTNFYCRFGEIDIIAIDQSNKPELVFIEVKTRKSTAFGEPQEAVTYSKKSKILKTALYFLNSSTKKLPFSWRVDVIGLKLDRSGKFKEITHIKNIFDG